MKTLIKNATLVLPTEVAKTNLLIHNGKIAMVDPAIHTLADETINAEGMHLLPGVIDDQVHFRDPGSTHKEDLHTGSKACAKGGVTTFLEMPNTNPTTTSRERLAEKIKIGESKSLVNFGFYIGATPNNVGELAKAETTPGIKIFIGSSTGDLLVDDQDALEEIFAETTLPICAHCEDESTIQKNREGLEFKSIHDHSRLRDHKAAEVSVARAADLARRHKHRFHVLHVSGQGEIPLFQDHQNVLTAEVCLHHLFFNVNDYDRLGSKVQMNPSLKFPEDNEGLYKALLSNQIQVIATDHAPHLLSEKDQPYPKSPSGLPAVENSLALMLNEVNHGRISLQRVVESMCDAPARVWDILGKGRIEEGYDADLVLVDMNKEAQILDSEQATKSGWSPWHGTNLLGWPVRTFIGGHEVFHHGQFDLNFRGKPATYDHSRGGYWANDISTRPL